MNRAHGQFGRNNFGWWFRHQWRENGVRRSVRGSGFPTKAAAQAAYRKAVRDLDEGRSVTASGTLAEFLEWWLDIYARSGKVKHSTITAVRGHVEKHIVPRLGSKALAKLSSTDVARFSADLLSNGEVRHKSGRGLNPKTVRNILGTLRKALDDGVKHGLVSRNVATNIDLPKWNRPEIEAWTEQDVVRFLTYAAESRDYLGPIWLLLANTPLRRAEICGLRWADVDLVEGLVHIRTTRLDVQGTVYEDTPKSRAGKRTVAIDTSCIVALAHLRNAQAEAAEILGGWASDLVLTDQDGQPIPPEALSRRFEQATRAAGLPRIRLHSLRHTYAAMALSNGVGVHVVSGRLGHADPSTTLRIYSPFMPRPDREAAEAIGGKLAALLGEGGANIGANLERLTATSHPGPDETPSE